MYSSWRLHNSTSPTTRPPQLPQSLLFPIRRSHSAPWYVNTPSRRPGSLAQPLPAQLTPRPPSHAPAQLATLPPLISYTPVTINLTNNATSTSTSLLRRDLFDARFQVLTQDEDAAEGEADADGAPVEPSATAQGKRKEEFVDEGTDLIKGVYEGGLKTWECSLDLVDCLDGLGYGLEVAPHQGDVLRGKSILEVSEAK